MSLRRLVSDPSAGALRLRGAWSRRQAAQREAGASAADSPGAARPRSPSLRLALASGIAVAALLGCTALARGESQLQPAPDAAPVASGSEAFQEDFDLANRRLSDTGESRYFVLRPGFQKVLASGGTASGALQRAFGRLLPLPGAGQTILTITVLDETRELAGVLTRVVEERETINGQLYEIARNYFAIDPQTGDVFYFGEDVNFYEGGRVVNQSGSWLADGSRNRTGLLVPGAPTVGMKYYQEVAPDTALDRAEVLSASDQCSTPAGVFEECLVLRETTPLEPRIAEQKIYAPGIGLVQDQALRLVSYGDVAPPQPRG